MVKLTFFLAVVPIVENNTSMWHHRRFKGM